MDTLATLTMTTLSPEVLQAEHSSPDEKPAAIASITLQYIGLAVLALVLSLVGLCIIYTLCKIGRKSVTEGESSSSRGTMPDSLAYPMSARPALSSEYNPRQSSDKKPKVAIAPVLSDIAEDEDECWEECETDSATTRLMSSGEVSCCSLGSKKRPVTPHTASFIQSSHLLEKTAVFKGKNILTNALQVTVHSCQASEKYRTEVVTPTSDRNSLNFIVNTKLLSTIRISSPV